MNQRLAVVLLVLMAVSCVQTRRGGHPGRPGRPGSPDRPGRPGHGPFGPGGSGGHGGPGGPFNAKRICSEALKPTAEYTEQMENVTLTCIEDIDGLQDIIDGLHDDSREDRHHSSKGSGVNGIASLLEANGYLTNATALRECVADGMGLLNNDGTFNMDDLKTNLAAMVAGLDVEANTQLGLDECPDVVDFDVEEYMACIMSYCMKGSFP